MRLGRFIERKWDGDPAAYGPRKARASFTYRAFVPDPIGQIRPSFTFETHALIAQAEHAVAKLNEGPGSV